MRNARVPAAALLAGLLAIAFALTACGSSGTTVSAAELAKLRQDRPDVRILVYDHSLQGNRAWYRFTMKWTDRGSGEVRTRAGLQSYRIEAGKLAETWVILQPLGSSWSDPVAQETWTSPPPRT